MFKRDIQRARENESDTEIQRERERQRVSVTERIGERNAGRIGGEQRESRR